MRKSRSAVIKAGLYFISLAILVYVVVYMPTPYMIHQPGSADEIKPMVSVAGGDQEEKGAFMLTTVSVSYANLAMLITTQFKRHAEIIRKEPDRNDEEYETQQRYYMSSSQSNSIMAAYKQAKIDYAVVPEYVFVVGFSKTVTPKGDFHPGDIIKKLNGEQIGNFEGLAAALKGKTSGDKVPLELERGGKKIDQQVELVKIGEENGEPKAGFGVSVGEVRKVQPSDPDKEVHFEDTRIGGPSAGLMFTLEIYNQLTPGDLSKGYRVAGTGTMSEDGSVGPIGGVQFKIVASERQHADIFFVPEDNYKEAKAKADEIKSEMKLVPVKQVDDALKYLEELPAKG
ncbi:SepM family pheromone-processing serine protease [Paenibacillus vini]|uniref:SepM family pheromone-processing serine protease n=1 Tax=Paenibacillus vini TaxID=1476024 RepID=UPI0025B678FF|nr:SepM family pheromone-processing serine protease [Paenibacillus vini]MDN4066790.1 SepM family pheromone-processing serine protease [Paenibacillus vini]